MSSIDKYYSKIEEIVDRGLDSVKSKSGMGLFRDLSEQGLRIPEEAELTTALMSISRGERNTVMEGLGRVPLIAIVGPTCTGKSDLALYLAEQYKSEIINADSRLIFDEMNIGTAKPNTKELSLVKHHLINIRKPNEIYSSGQYRKDFDQLFTGERTIVVGGTGMYLRAALEDLNMPEFEGDLEYRKVLEKKSLSELRERLRGLEERALGDRINPVPHQASLDRGIDNKRRLSRAIEYIEKTGEKFSENRKKLGVDRYPAIWIGVNYKDRGVLYEKINSRAHKMIDAGLVDEVKALVEKYGRTDTLMNTIGYGEIIGYLDGEHSLDAGVELIQKKTRNYAKRQMTWFRNNPRIHWINI